MGMTQKYELHKNGNYLGDFTMCQITKDLLTSSEVVLSAVYDGTEINGYTVKKAQTAENECWKSKALKNWDEIRFRLNPNAKRGV